MFAFILPFLVNFIGISHNSLIQPSAPKVLASHEFSLEDRYGNTFVNDVFKDNILLALNYMDDKKIDPAKVDWTEVEQPAAYTFTLQPGQVFSFHDDVLPQYKGKDIITTNSHFNSDEGFKSDGYLVGDGVCHLASLMYWVAKDAGLDALAPTRHDFAPVPDVPREYGTAIYETPGGGSANEEQNLYITNNKNKPVEFTFINDGKSLKITAEEQS